MNDEPLYQMEADFKIKDGQLDGLSNERSFELGVQFGRVIDLAQQDNGFRFTAYRANKDRIEALLWRHKRQYAIESHSRILNMIIFHVQQK